MKTKNTKTKTSQKATKSLQKAADDAVVAILDLRDAAAEIISEKSLEVVNLKMNARKIADADLLKENEELKKQLSMSYGHFDSEKELKAYKTFCKKHEKCMLSRKINGGKFPYIVLNGTGIGVCKKVVCQVCGESKEITDISVW